VRNFRKLAELTYQAWYGSGPPPRHAKGSRKHRQGFEPLETRLMLNAGPLVISEFLAFNQLATIDDFGTPDPNLRTDDQGRYSDWIEIHNPTATPVDLTGWYLTDDAEDLTKWAFPDTEIGADQYLVVFASGDDRDDPLDELHTNFRIDGDGEYLALIGPDGSGGIQTSYAYAPEFPQQYTNISYGPTAAAAAFSLEASGFKYLVPRSSQEVLGTSWTAAGFDDSAWDSFSLPPQVLITEVGTVADFVEIENLSREPIDTSGWVVAANNAVGREADINSMHSTLWPLPDLMEPGDVFYRHDDPDEDPDDATYNESYWGEAISWKTAGPGWVMIVDEKGNVVDFVVWEYSDAEIASLAVNINGFDVSADGAWSGAAVVSEGARDRSLQRRGGTDNNGQSDWAFVNGVTMGEENDDLVIPFAGPGAPTIGFETVASDVTEEIVINVADVMHEENATIWTRIHFEVEEPGALETMQLQMQYNDGFVAYINGRKVAEYNASASPAWNSAATDAVEGFSQYGEFDLTDFVDLLQEGTNLLAIQGLNVAAEDGNFFLAPKLVASARQYFDPATPGYANGPSFGGYVKDTQFSFDRGFYEAPFNLAITSDTPGATIYYTLDGSEPYLDLDGVDPDLTHGIEYTGPVPIETTTILRAIAFKENYRPTNIDTQTYIFLADVVRQDYQATLDAGFPSSWGGTSPDYGMDSQVIGTFDEDGNPLYGDSYGGIYANTIIDDLQSLPTLSIVTGIDGLFDSSEGIYTNSGNRGLDWERASSAELIYPETLDTESGEGPSVEGFQVDCGLRIQGGAFRNHSLSKKHSLRLRFGAEYGASKLEYDWFGGDAVDRFDTITLRAGANDGYTWSSARYTEQYIRDEFGRSLQRAAGQVSAHGTFVHLYLNGIYWGLYNPVERPDDSFSASYFGGEKEDWDSLHVNEITAGSRNAWNQMLSLCQSAANSDAAYQRLQGNNPDGTPNPAYPDYLDVENYVDYLTINVWGGNWDWPWKNWWAGRYQLEDSTGFKFYNWDFENTMGNNLGRSPLNKNALNNNFSSAGEPHANLKNNDEYKLFFADRAHRLLFNDGVLTPDSMIARYSELADTVERAIVAESARWGDTKHSTPLTLQDWYDADSNYNDGRAALGWILNYYLPRRSDIVVDQLIEKGLYPTVKAPVFSQHGGLISTTDRLTMPASAGTVYYTTDGSDPRLPGGNVSPTARVYSGSPVYLTDSGSVRARALSGGQWSALNEAKFYIDRPATAENLVVTELNYDPYDPMQAERDQGYTDNDDFEFIELRNISQEAIYLGGVRFTAGIDFDFNGSEVNTLDGGEHVVVAQNPAAFRVRYGSGINVVGGYDTRFSNNGERIALSDRFDQPIFDFSYDNTGNWPGRAGGNGSSLELIYPDNVPPGHPERDAVPADGNNWRSSSEYGGSPGTEGEGPRGDVVVNEVLTHTDWPEVDTIELYNATAVPIDIGGWYLSDSNSPYTKYCIPEGITIPGHGYRVFDEDDFNSGFPQPGDVDFALNGAHGDDVWLLETDSHGRLVRFVDRAEFPAAVNGESFGRWPNGYGELYPMVEPTLNPPGFNSGPRLGSVIVSEVQYNPAGVLGDDDLEFVEIYNTTTQAVDLTNWRIRKGIDFDFPAGTVLGSHAAVVIVPFALSEAGKLDDFCDAYEISPASVNILGGYRDVLDNGGERVQLQRPDLPPLDEPGFIPRLLEDEVRYDDDPPWPVAADGTGQSLNRVSEDDWGNDPAGWIVASPTPGTVLPSGEAQVVKHYVFYDNSPGFGCADGAIAADKEALLPGQTASFANYTSYASGINGVMIDVAGLPDGAMLDQNDFEFRMGNSDDPEAWDEAPLPTSVTVRPGVGYGGSDRVTLTWNDTATKNQWLQIKVLDTANTDLPLPHVFYFGNAVGESGDSGADAKVNAADILLTRNNPRNLLNPAPIEFRYDFNRDRRVNATDLLIARENQTHFLDALRLITVPTDGPANKQYVLEESLGLVHQEQDMATFLPDADEAKAGVKIEWLFALDQLEAKTESAKKDRGASDATQLQI